MALQETILIVDDDTLVLHSLKRLLKSRGYDVSIACNPTSALALCAKYKFDLIISDQKMPVMKGTEFARKAVELQPQTRIILISGYSNKSDVACAFNENVIHKYVKKPWDNGELLAFIVEQLCIA
jgi:response regulator RpfG family c-di-GMP phosphodiesterase